MTTSAELATVIGNALRIPLGEVRSVARRQRMVSPRPAGRVAPGRGTIGALEAGRLLVDVMVMRIEGPTTPAATLIADIERLTRLRHGAPLYFDADFILPDDFIGAIGEILAAFADPGRRDRAEAWIGRVGLARGAGRMAGWVEVRASAEEEWEDFDYAASGEDLITILDRAPIVRRVEVRMAALREIAGALARPA